MCEFFDKEQEADDIKKLIGRTGARNPVRFEEMEDNLSPEAQAKLKKYNEIRTQTLQRVASKGKAYLLLAEAYRTGNFDVIIEHLQKAKEL